MKLTNFFDKSDILLVPVAFLVKDPYPSQRSTRHALDQLKIVLDCRQCRVRLVGLRTTPNCQGAGEKWFGRSNWPRISFARVPNLYVFRQTVLGWLGSRLEMAHAIVDGWYEQRTNQVASALYPSCSIHPHPVHFSSDLITPARRKLYIMAG